MFVQRWSGLLKLLLSKLRSLVTARDHRQNAFCLAEVVMVCRCQARRLRGWFEPSGHTGRGRRTDQRLSFKFRNRFRSPVKS